MISNTACNIVMPRLRHSSVSAAVLHFRTCVAGLVVFGLAMMNVEALKSPIFQFLAPPRPSYNWVDLHSLLSYNPVNTVTENNSHSALLHHSMFYLDMYGLMSFAPIGVIIAGIGYSVLSQ
jgi:hypothetical protein